MCPYQYLRLTKTPKHLKTRTSFGGGGLYASPMKSHNDLHTVLNNNIEQEPRMSIVDQLNVSDFSQVAQDASILADPISIATMDVEGDEGYTSSSEYEYDTDDSLEHELALINAQLQWEESVSQLKLLLNIVILPVIGKAIGRKLAGFSESSNIHDLLGSWFY